MFRSYRQIIAYDPLLGHKYVPNLHARIRYGRGAYFIETDKNGFRNSPERLTSNFTVLLLGDSYAAGDGVANADRFSDLIERDFDCTVINLAVNGYGVDQQILAYEMYKDRIPHDIVLFMPHMDDLYRNMRENRVGKNRLGENIFIPKPYYNIDGNQLVLKNQPVPIERPSLKESAPTSKETRAVADALNKNKNALKHLVNRSFKKHVVGKLSYQELNSSESREWRLMNKLIDRLKSLSASKHLVIAPIPYNYVVMEKEPQYYMPFFYAHEDKRTTVIDLLPALQDNYEQNQDRTYLPLCGHFTGITHREIGHVLGMRLTEYGVKKRSKHISYASTSTEKYVLGISCYYHDSAAAIIKGGEIIAAAQEERFTRKKHDPSFPANAIHYCLEEAKIDINDLSSICYYDNEALSIERILNNYSSIPHSKKESFWSQAEKGIARKLKLRTQLRDVFDYQGQLTKTHHHHSHAASAFYPSPFDKAAILVVDGVGEWACSSIGIGRGNEVSILQQQDYPDSLGLLYSAITYFCGFKVNSGEYKLMGLAPYGQPIYSDLIKKHLIEIHKDGSIKLNLDYFGFHLGEAMTNEKFDELIGGPRRHAESRIKRREMDLAASIQLVTEEVLMKMMVHAHELTGMECCVMAGGVALNCVANGKLLTRGPFKDIWIQPASGDAGGAVGAALDYYYQRIHQGDRKADYVQQHSYLGPSFSDQSIKGFLDTLGLQYHRFNNKAVDMADWLTQGKIIGYFEGRMEFGPRALGNRSFLGDPTKPQIQSKMNLKIKFRESFRPFAPIVAEDEMSEYFETDKTSPFMLLVHPVRAAYRKQARENKIDNDDMISHVNQVRSELPAITHVDYSARLQSMNNVDSQNPAIYALLKEMKKATGYGVLVNTSFNVRGEPIVCSPEDAYQCFMRTEADFLVLGDYYLIKEEQPDWSESEYWQKEFELD